jgi:hypothetical protein
VPLHRDTGQRVSFSELSNQIKWYSINENHQKWGRPRRSCFLFFFSIRKRKENDELSIKRHLIVFLFLKRFSWKTTDGRVRLNITFL